MHAWWSELRSRALLQAIEAAPGTVEHATRARRRVIPRPVRRPHTTVRLRIAFITGLSCAASVTHQNFGAASTFRMFHGTWCGFDRRSSARDRTSDYMHAFSISDDLIP